MTTVNTNISRRSNPISSIVRYFAALHDAMERHRGYLITRKQLSALSDHQLKDIGMTRGEIEYVSREFALNK